MNNSRLACQKYQEIFSKDFLFEQHHTLQKTPLDIAKEIGCDRNTVIKYMELRGIPYIYRKDTHGKKRAEHYAWRGYGEISSSYWNNVKTGARLRHIPLEVTLQQIWELYLKQNRLCALSGAPIGFHATNDNSASLDRIDAAKGYTLDNVQWVHRDINFAKQSLTNLAFVELCRKIVSHADSISLQ